MWLNIISLIYSITFFWQRINWINRQITWKFACDSSCFLTCLLWGYCFGGVSYLYSWAPLGVWSHLLGCCKKDATRVWAVARRTGVGWSSDECQGFQHPWNGGLQWWQNPTFFGRKPKEGPVFSFFWYHESRLNFNLGRYIIYIYM